MAFCPSCGERVDPTKPYCASCGAKLDESDVSRRSPVTSEPDKRFFRKINWRVYALAALILVLAVLWLTYEPFNSNKDVPFAQWGQLTEQEKATLVTTYMEENHSGLTSPEANEIIRYCDLLYKKSGGKDGTMSSVLNEFVVLDKEKRIAIIAELSGDLIE